MKIITHRCFLYKNWLIWRYIGYINAKIGNQLGVIQRNFVYLQAEIDSKNN